MALRRHRIIRTMTARRAWRIGFAGFGNVNRALASLLLDCRDEMERRHGLAFTPVLAGTKRRGAIVSERGLDLPAILEDGWSGGPALDEALEHAAIDLLFEATPLEPRTGEPATTRLRRLLDRGVAVVSANKGPLAFAAAELLALARRRSCGFRFESTVADCLPVFDLFEAVLPAGRIERFEGVLNTTSNRVLHAMAEGRSLDDAVRGAQQAGVAEAEPSHDLDGWDQAVKGVIVANVLCGRDLRPRDVERTPVSAVDLDWLRREERDGATVRLAVTGGRAEPVRVAPIAFPPGSFLSTLGAGALGACFETDRAGTLRVASAESTVAQTAYGMLSDFVAIHQGRLFVPSPLLGS
jgi:homoserine dehydrogenase